MAPRSKQNGTEDQGSDGSDGAQDQGQGTGDDEEDEDFDKERALATIRKLRQSEKDNKGKLSRLSELETKVKEYEDASKTEKERLEARIAELEGENKSLGEKITKTELRSDVRTKAAAMGFRNPDLGVRLVDLDEVEFDKDGKPVNVDKLLKQIVKENPFLIPNGGADGGAGGAGGGKGDRPNESMNAQIRRAAGKSV